MLPGHFSHGRNRVASLPRWEPYNPYVIVKELGQMVYAITPRS